MGDLNGDERHKLLSRIGYLEGMVDVLGAEKIKLLNTAYNAIQEMNAGMKWEKFDGRTYPPKGFQYLVTDGEFCEVATVAVVEQLHGEDEYYFSFNENSKLLEFTITHYVKIKLPGELP